MGRCVGGAGRSGTWDPADLPGRGTGGIGHRVHRQPGSSIVCHDQRRRSTAELLGLAVCRCSGCDARGGQIPAVTPTMRSLATSRASSRPTRRPHPIGANLALESGTGGGQGVARDVLVDVHRLSMLPQVVESREPPRAVALERTLSSVFSNMPGQVFTPGEAQVAGRVIRAVEALALLLLGWGSIPLVVRLHVRAFTIAIRVCV